MDRSAGALVDGLPLECCREVLAVCTTLDGGHGQSSPDIERFAPLTRCLRGGGLDDATAQARAEPGPVWEGDRWGGGVEHGFVHAAQIGPACRHPDPRQVRVVALRSHALSRSEHRASRSDGHEAGGPAAPGEGRPQQAQPRFDLIKSDVTDVEPGHPDFRAGQSRDEQCRPVFGRVAAHDDRPCLGRAQGCAMTVAAGGEDKDLTIEHLNDFARRWVEGVDRGEGSCLGCRAHVLPTSWA